MSDSKFKRNIGNFIQMTRKSRRLTQAEVAARMNINAQNVSAYERGEISPTVEWLLRLCKALEIDPKEFFLDLIVDLTGRKIK